MSGSQAVSVAPFPHLLKVGVRRVLTAVWATGGQERSRRNAAEALAAEQARGRASSQAWLELVAADEQWQALLAADRIAARRSSLDAAPRLPGEAG